MDSIGIVRDRVALSELRDIAATQFGDMVKAVVDVTRGIMAIGGELHADEESALLDDGSKQVAHGGTPTAARWATLSIVEQLANVGSEVERALCAYERGQRDRWEHAMARALELFDLTASDGRWRGPRRREILRAREEFCRVFFGDDVSPTAVKQQQEYFLQFAVAARQHRG